MMQETIHTGLIGFGLSGRVFHAPFLHTHPGFHLTAVVERHTEKAKEIYPYVETVKDYRDLLNDERLDLLVLAVPNIHHFPMARDALLAGKDIIIEKPFVPRSAEADELIAISRDTGKRIFVYQNRRWDGDFLTISKLLEEGSLGMIRYYEAHFDRYRPEIKAGSWRDEDIPGGGILYDLGSHLIDQALCLFGMPEALAAEIRSERTGSPVDDYFRLELQYPDKTAVLTAGMMVKEKGPRFIVEGTNGSFSKWGSDPQEAALKAGAMPAGDNWGSDAPENYGILNKGEAVPQDPLRLPTEKGNYMAFYDNVFENLFKNKAPAVRPEEARDVIFIIEKAFECRNTGQASRIR
jgi:predicted dehydrogenase